MSLCSVIISVYLLACVCIMSGRYLIPNMEGAIVIWLMGRTLDHIPSN